MATWAYQCYRCADGGEALYVAASDVEEMAPSVRIVRVKIGSRWVCAVLDRSVRVEVEGLLIRAVIGTDAAACSDCRDEG